MRGEKKENRKKIGTGSLETKCRLQLESEIEAWKGLSSRRF